MLTILFGKLHHCGKIKVVDSYNPCSLLLGSHLSVIDSGEGAPHKVLKAYTGEAVWLVEPPKAYLATMLRVIIVLLWQHEDQLKSGLS